MEKKAKIKIIICVSVCYAILTLIVSFISYALISEGKTINELLNDNDGRSAFIQLFLSMGIIIISVFAITLKRWALNVLNSLLLLSFVNILVATLLSSRVKFVDILNPLLWIPIVIIVILTRPKVKEQFK